MPFALDVISVLTGIALGACLSALFFWRGRSGFETHLKDKASKLETDLQAALQRIAKLDAEKNFLLETRDKMLQDFKAMSLEALNASRENFLALAQEKFAQMQTGAAAHIKEVVAPVSQTLMTLDHKVTLLEKERQNAYGELREHLKTMRVDQDRLKSETSNLVQALRSPSTRGQWGEMQLKRALEMSGMVENVHFRTQITTDGQRPDVVVFLPGGKSIVIDAKAPIDGYLDALKEGIGEAERFAALDRHARHVRDRIRELSAKSYWEKFDTPEFVVMFLPAESYFSAALERDPSLIEAGVEQKVIPASPTTLISLLKAVMYGWQQEKLAANAQHISELGAQLYKRLCTFAEHLEKIGGGLNSAVSNYNKAVSSFSSRIVPTGREFQKLQNLQKDDALPELTQIEVSPALMTDMSGEAETTDAQTGDGRKKAAS
jgi:DNA recombination protein RmuC